MTQDIQPNTVWRHYKGNLYTVLCVAEDERTGAQMVVYVLAKPTSPGRTRLPKTRPIAEWTGWSETGKPRYERVE